MNFIAMSAGAAALLVVSALAGESFALPEAGKTQIALVYLVAATVGLFLMVLCWWCSGGRRRGRRTSSS